jgi:selenide, water dikinase
MQMSPKNLTARVKAGGCASKLSPAILDSVLPRVPRLKDPNVLVGFDTNDDAGVYRVGPELALVQTTDFFTPIVDDPHTFGAVAAANALSDVYAMGGRPVTALSILCYPGKGDLDDLEEILRGGAEKMIEAGCAVLGGHSVSDDEIKFGYAVTGLIHPGRILANSGARPGDVLVFTKKIGTGVISTALKRGIAKDEHVQGAIDSMLTLNKSVCEQMLAAGAHGCTDVTGFGLLGHAREMAMASGVTLEIDAASIEFLPGAVEYARQGTLPGGLNNNRAFAECAVAVRGTVDELLLTLLYDPQTSGGLLISVPEQTASSIQGRIIGRVAERAEKPVVVQ